MRSAKIDANQPAIVSHLRARGASVQILSAVGKGCPDLLVGWGADNYLVEIKVPKAKGQSAGKLTPDQKIWHAGWKGCVSIVYTTDDVDKLLAGESLLEPTTTIRRRRSALEKKP